MNFSSLEGLQSGRRSERHLLEIRRNFDFVPIPVSYTSNFLCFLLATFLLETEIIREKAINK